MAREIELHVERDGYEIIARGDASMFGIWTRYLNPYSQPEYRGSGSYTPTTDERTWKIDYRWFSGSPLSAGDEGALTRAVKGHFDAQEAAAVAGPPSAGDAEFTLERHRNAVGEAMRKLGGRDLNVIIAYLVGDACRLPPRVYVSTPRGDVRARLVSIAAAALAGIDTIDAERR